MPVAGAEVQVGYVHRSKNGGDIRYSSWGYLPDRAVRGTPAERFYFAKSDANGSFEFAALPIDSELILRVTAKGWAELNTAAGGPKEGQHVVKADAKPARLVLKPEAIIRGRVTSDVHEISPDTAEIQFEGKKEIRGFRRILKPDAEGNFSAAGLPAGPISVALGFPGDAPATAVGDVAQPAWTAPVPKTGAEQEVKRLEGAWTIASIQVEGRVAADPKAKGESGNFKGVKRSLRESAG